MSADPLSQAGADVVNLAVIEALARRAAAQPQGLARDCMLRRVEALRAARAARSAPATTADAAATAGTAAMAAVATSAASAPSAGLAALSDLVDRLGRQDQRHHSIASPAPAPLRQAPALKSLTAFQGTWSRLRADQRLRQAGAQVPAGAGPLNSAHLVSRAMQAMRELSPAYLDAFIAQVDTLLWLEQSAAGAGTAPPRTDRRAGRGARGRLR
ncbi:MAG: DUF2894 domain-containing protein [Burkholderiales bacterium]|nr:DUF2894 domain-containing protein [Burkholderiales bacterium]